MTRAKQNTAAAIVLACPHSLADLKPAPYNPRKISKRAKQGLKASLREFGDISGIVWNQRSGHLVCGHQRLAALREEHGDKLSIEDGAVVTLAGERFPVRVVDWDDATEKAANVEANNPHVAGDFTIDVSDILAEIRIDDEALFSELRLDDIDLSDLQEPGGVNGKDPDDVPEPPAKPKTKLGDLYLLGKHRLLCGDSTNADDVARVMNGEKADLGLTSPPYAVGKEYEKGISFEKHITMLEAIADNCLSAVCPGGFFFVNFGEIASMASAGPLTGSKRQCIYLISADYYRIFRARNYDLYAQRIWYKPFNRLQQPFWSYHTSIPHYQEWEHIWTWRLPGGTKDKKHDWDISVHACVGYAKRSNER